MCSSSTEIQITCSDVAGLYKYSKLHQGTCLGLHKPVIIIDCQLMCIAPNCMFNWLCSRNTRLLSFFSIFFFCMKLALRYSSNQKASFFPLGVHCPFKKKLPVTFRHWMHLFYLIWRYNRGNEWIVTCYILSCWYQLIKEITEVFFHGFIECSE